MRKFYLILPMFAALAVGCGDDKSEIPPPSPNAPTLSVEVVEVERTKVSFSLTTDKGVDYAYAILPADAEAPASAEALFLLAEAKSGMFDKTTVAIDDRGVSANNAYTLYAAARTINPFIYSDICSASVDTHFDYKEAITLDAVTRNSYAYHIKPEAEGQYRHICVRKADYEWFVAYMGINPAMYVGTFGYYAEEGETYSFEDSYFDERDYPVYIYSGTEYIIIYGMSDPANPANKVLATQTLEFSTVKVDQAPYNIAVSVDHITSMAAEVKLTPEEGIVRYRVLVNKTAEYDAAWIEGESSVRAMIIGDPSSYNGEYDKETVVQASGLDPNTDYTVGVVGFDKENREKVIFKTFVTTEPTGPVPTIAIEPEEVAEPWHQVSVAVKAQHAVNLWVCLEKKSEYDRVLEQPGVKLSDIIVNNGIELTPEQLAKALADGVLCQSDELNPFTEYIYGFHAVNEEGVSTTETYEFRTEAAPVVDLRMQLVGDFDATLTDMDGQEHTFRVSVSDGPNDALKTEYEQKNQLAVLGFEPCGVAYRSPQELLDNGWAATEEEANANYGPKFLLEVKQDNTVATTAVNPNTSELDYLMAKFDGKQLYFMGYSQSGSGRISSTPTCFPVEVSEDRNTLTVQAYHDPIFGTDSYPGVYQGDNPWYGGTDLFRGGSEMVLTRVQEQMAAGMVRCTPRGGLRIPQYVRIDVEARSVEATPRIQMLHAFSSCY